MTKSEILDLPRPKQVQLLISICIQGKFNANYFFNASKFLNERHFSMEAMFFNESSFSMLVVFFKKIVFQ